MRCATEDGAPSLAEPILTNTAAKMIDADPRIRRIVILAVGIGFRR